MQRAGRVDRGDQARCLGEGTARAGLEPVPAALRIGAALLLREQQHEALARRERLQARAAREARGILVAAMQHHEQGQRVGFARAGRLEQPVSARARRPERHAGEPVARSRGCRWLARPRGRPQRGLQRPRRRFHDRARAAAQRRAGQRTQRALKRAAPEGLANAPHHGAPVARNGPSAIVCQVIQSGRPVRSSAGSPPPPAPPAPPERTGS